MSFDPAVFEQMMIDQSNETKTTPVPEGSYEGLIDGVRIKSVEIKKGDRAGSTVPVLSVTYALNDDDGKLKSTLNRDKVTVTQDLWLDITEQGALAFGPNQNVGLGRLRDAVGLNKPGKAFSFPMLEGQGPIMIHVTNNEYNGDVYDRVAKVTRVGSDR